MDRPKRQTCRRVLFSPDDNDKPEKPLTKSEKRKVINERYRKKLKDDPERYAQYKAYDKAWQRQYRLSLTEEKKAAARENTRLRNIAYRQRQKEKKLTSTPRPATRPDAKKLEERRERNRLSQQKRRQEMSSQKKRREREASLVYYYQTKQRERQEINPHQQSPSPKPAAVPHRSTISRLKKRLGGNLILSLKGIIRSVSKKEKNALKSVGISYESPTKKKSYMPSSPLRRKRDKHSLIVKRFLKGLSPKKLYAKKQQHAAIIQKFYDIKSNFLPGKTGVSHTLKVKKCLDKSIVQLHQDFIQAHGTLVSRATFFRHRPKNILTFGKTPFRQCLCEICLNPMLKAKVLNSNGWPKVDTLKKLINLTLCYGERKECLHRLCNSCGVGSIDGAVNLFNCDVNKTVCWQKWERVKRKNGVRVDLVKKEGSLIHLISELKSELINLPLHDFVHRWQSSQFSTIIHKVPESWAVVVLDFSENYLCVQQDQPQSAYFGYSQVTVHPCVIYYGCSCGMRVTDNWTFVSDVLLHNADMVHCITERILSHLQSLHISKVVVFSDGCAAQYKSRLPFSYLQTYSNSTGLKLKVQRCYFGARHGKNPCDALGGLLKQAASRSVRARKSTVQNAHDLYMFASENLSVQPSSSQNICTHMRRNYFHLKEQDIVDAALTFGPVRPLHGTRKLHDIVSTKDGLMVRNLSCFCPPCRNDNFKSCHNMNHVDSYQLCAQFLPISSNLNVTEPDMDDAFIEPGLNDAFIEPGLDDAFVEPGLDDDSLAPDVDDHCEIANSTVYSEEEPRLPAQIQHSRETFFAEVQTILSACTSFDELHVAVREISPALLEFPLPCKYPFHTIRSVGGTIDSVALRHFTPLGISLVKHLFPVETVRDGNCVPRALSLHCFGSQDNHLELRVRIVHEMVSNAMDYMCLPPDDLSFLFCHSDYPSGSPESVFRLEALNVCKASVYMGMWQLMAAANALHVNILSLYSHLGPNHYRTFYTRPLKARQPCSSHAFVLFWSSTAEHEAVMPVDYWTANHVVPLMPKEVPSLVDIDDIL